MTKKLDNTLANYAQTLGVKPCPFCGETPELWAAWGNRNEASISCKNQNCNAWVDVWDGYAEGAVDYWNRLHDFIHGRDRTSLWDKFRKRKSKAIDTETVFISTRIKDLEWVDLTLNMGGKFRMHASTPSLGHYDITMSDDGSYLIKYLLGADVEYFETYPKTIDEAKDLCQSHFNDIAVKHISELTQG